MTDPNGGETSTHSQSTEELRARYQFRSQPIKSLSLGDVADLLVSHAAGECSEGALADITGMNRDTLRGMIQNAISQSDRLFKLWQIMEEERFKESRRWSALIGSVSESDTTTTAGGGN